MATQKIIFRSWNIAGDVSLFVDLHPIAAGGGAGAAIETDLELFQDDTLPGLFVGSRVGSDAGLHYAAVRSSAGGDLQEGPGFIDLQDADGNYHIFRDAVPPSLIDALLTAQHGAGSWLSPAAGTGARTIDVTVDDGTDPLEGAKVRLTKGAETYIGTTDVAGQVTFNVDDGTWVVAITLAGYTFAGASLVVTGDDTPTYTMTAITITPSDPGFVTVFSTVRDESNVAEENVTVTCEFLRAGAGVGTVHDRERLAAVSDVDGLIQFANRLPGVKYRFKRGALTFDHTIPAGASDPYELPDWGGKEE